MSETYILVIETNIKKNHVEFHNPAWFQPVYHELIFNYYFYT